MISTTNQSSTNRIPQVSSSIHSSSVGLLFIFLFSLSQFFFLAQSWMPEIFGIPLQVLLVWLLMIWAVLVHMRGVKRALSVFSKTQWVAIVLLGGSILLRTGLDGWDLQRFAQFITGIIIALLASMVFTKERGQRSLLRTLSLGAALSGAIAILQYLDAFPWLWWATVYSGLGYVYGSAGLESSPVSFAYSILGPGTFVIGLVVLRLQRQIKIVPFSSTLVFLLSILIAGGLLASRSRSGVLGLVLGIAIIIFARHIPRASDTAPNARKRTPGVATATKLAVLIGYIVLLLLAGLISYAFLTRATSPLQDLRVVETWRVYLPLILENPLGIPAAGDLMQALDQMGTSAYLNALQRSGGRFIAPHNLLLTTGVTYGPVAALALLILYTTALRDGTCSFSELRRSGQTSRASWVLLLIAVNVGILAHSWFHNASIAMGEMRNWLWLGLLLAASKVPGIVHDPD